MHSSRLRFFLLLAALVLAGAAAVSCAPQQQEPGTAPETPEATQPAEPGGVTPYSADLAAVEGVTTTASGASTVQIEGDSATFSVTVQELSDINMAHIHIAEEPGGSGPPAVWLYPTDAQEPRPIEGVTNGELASGTFSASEFVGPLEGMTMDDLITAIGEGRAYVNVHTAANPDGEISGFLQQ